MTLPDREIDPPDDCDPDASLCTDCGGWFDGLEADEEGRCPRCQTGIGVGGTSGCAGGGRCAHTPGPWFRTNIVAAAFLKIETSEKGGGEIARVRLRSDPYGRNARLIASAPDLYEVVRKLVFHESPPDMLWERARAALAKAEGRTR